MTTEELKAILKKEGNYKAFEYKGYKPKILTLKTSMIWEYGRSKKCLKKLTIRGNKTLKNKKKSDRLSQIFVYQKKDLPKWRGVRVQLGL